MNGVIDRLLHRYEGGRMTRRDLIMSLSAIVMAQPKVTAQPSSPPIQVRGLNHVTLSVSDIPRSVEFYQGLFGMPVQSRQGTGTNLAAGSGSQFIGIFGGRSGNVDIGHFCLGVEGFDADRIMRTLEARGVEARVRMRDGTIPEVYLNDPDGIQVQLQDVSYCGGTGVLGNQCG